MKKFVAMTAAIVAAGMIMTGCGSNDTAEPTTEPAKTEAPKQDTTTGTDTKKEEAAAPAGNEQVINVTATNWEWKLDKTEVKKGQPVKLVFDGKEGMHGVTVKGTSIDNLHVMPGKTAEATFTPDKAGEYEMICSLMCGTGHATMKTTIKVVD